MLLPPSTLPPGSIVDSYRRDSGGMRQDKSTDQQLTEIEAFCKQYGLIHRHKFVDAARSGGSTAGREDFNRMMEMYEAPANCPTGLILWNYARFARDIDDAQFNKIRLRQWGIIIHSLNDSVPEGEYGRVIEFLIDVANEEKRKQTSTDAKRGLKDLVEKYRCVPGTPPAGFKRTPVNLGQRRDKTEHIAHRWDPDPELIPRIQQAWQMKAAGSSVNQIHKATRLYSSLNSYTTFFKNKLYIGILEFGDLTVEGYCEPLIDIHIWNAVQKIVALHADRQHVSSPTGIHPRRKSETATYLLSGLIECGRCSSPLYGMTSGQRDGSYYLRYACTRRTRRRDCDFPPIPAKSIEKEVITQLTKFFDHPANLQALIEAAQKQNADQTAKDKTIGKDLQKQINTLRRSISNITTAIGESGHSAAMLERLKQLEAQESELTAQLNLIKTQAPAPRQALSPQDIAQFSKSISARLQAQDPLLIRTLFNGLIHKVIIDRNKTHAFGTIIIHTPREPQPPSEDEPSPARSITASSLLRPVGAPSHTRSIPFLFSIKNGRPKKKPLS